MTGGDHSLLPAEAEGGAKVAEVFLVGVRKKF